MRAKFEFDLPEDQDDFNDFVKARENASIVFELRHNYWRNWKHQDDWSSDQWKVHDDMMDQLYTELNKWSDD
jgi:hypothetical protein